MKTQNNFSKKIKISFFSKKIKFPKNKLLSNLLAKQPKNKRNKKNIKNNK